MEDSESKTARWILYVFLFVISAGVVFLGFGALVFFTMFFGWLIAPSEYILGGVLLVHFGLALGLFLLARRKRWGCLKAIVYGGVSAPVLLIVLGLFGPDPPDDQKPNQRQPLVSPSGKYVLTVPIERSRQDRGPLGFGLPYWHVTISDPKGQVVYRDPNESFVGIRNVYWVWGQADRVWLFDSDGGAVYVYEQTDGTWSRHEWGHGTGYTAQGITPPPSLYPDYVHSGPAPVASEPENASADALPEPDE